MKKPDTIQFSKICCGDWFRVDWSYYIRCEEFSDFSDQIWNAIDLYSGTLYFFKKTQAVIQVNEIPPQC